MLRTAFLIVALAGAATAQQASRPFSADFTIGPNWGSGGHPAYYDDGSVTANLTLVPEHRGPVIGALALGAHARVAQGDVCRILPGTASGCAPDFPDGFHLGVLGGVEQATRYNAIRVMAGPAMYWMNGGSGLAAQFQADASAGWTHVQVVAAVRGAAIRRFRGETLRMHSLGFGLRIQ